MLRQFLILEYLSVLVGCSPCHNQEADRGGSPSVKTWNSNLRSRERQFDIPEEFQVKAQKRSLQGCKIDITNETNASSMENQQSTIASMANKQSTDWTLLYFT
jgi:hypothetical protein